MQNSRPLEGYLLVSDMDRTLITDAFTVPERNIEAINRFVDEGGKFTLATGRSASSAVKYLGRVNINAPAILSNGGSIYDLKTEKILWNTSLPKSARDLLAKIIEAYPSIGAELYIDENIHIVNMNEWTKRHIINEGFKHSIEPLKDAPDGWQKILFADTNENLHKIDDFINANDHEGCETVFSNEHYFEVLPKDVSKGTALKKLAEIVGGVKTIVGAGDFYNDVTLIEMADIGVAVECAPDDIKKRAQFVTGPCENGAIADVIEYLEKLEGITNLK